MGTQQTYQIATRFTLQEAVTAQNCSRLAIDSAKHRAAALAEGDKANARYHTKAVIEHAQYLERGLTMIAARNPQA